MPVNTKHPDVTTWLPVWEQNREAYLGDRIIRFGANQETYLPRITEDQSDKAYATFKNRTYFFEATSRTIDGMVGIALWKPVIYNLPEQMEGLIDNNKIKTMLLSEYQAARFGLLLDRTSEENSAVKCLIYSAENIINYRQFPNGEFEFVVLKELEEAGSADDKYKNSDTVVYRELRINEEGNYEQVMHTADEKGNWLESDPVIPTKDGEPLKSIPFNIYNTRKASTAIEPPPIAGIVRSNIAYYQIYAEIRHKYHWSAIIQPTVYGLSADEAKTLKLGGKHVWGFKNKDAHGEFLETAGNCFGALDNGLKNELERMSSLGSRLLEPQKKAGEAAETVRLRQTAEVATTSTLVGTVEGACHWAIETAADWYGITVDPAETLKMSRDFITSTMEPDMIDKLVNAWLVGALDDANLFLNWKDGEVIKNDITQEEFILQLKSKKAELDSGDEIEWQNQK